MRRRSGDEAAFTLIELLVVITIIAILIGLLFPAFRGVQDQAKRTQAKNDLSQIVMAVNAYYTEYGKYPLVTADTTYGSSPANSALLNELRATTTATQNPRQIVFLSPPSVKDDMAGNRRSGISPTDSNYYDPWGTPYNIEIDGGYDNQLTNPYNNNTGAGPGTLNIGVIGWSFGADVQIGTAGDKIYKNSSGVQSDDVISWQ